MALRGAATVMPEAAEASAAAAIVTPMQPACRSGRRSTRKAPAFVEMSPGVLMNTGKFVLYTP